MAKSEMLELILQKIEETQALILNRGDDCEVVNRYDELAFMFEDSMEIANEYIDYLENRVRKLKKKNKKLKKRLSC